MNKHLVRMSLPGFLFAVFVLLFNTIVRAQGDAASLYKTKCAACHGADGRGDTVVGKKLGARDFASSDVQNETDAQLIEITAKGKNKMPGYEKSLKDSQIKDFVAYIRELAKKK
jgi:cytochrome c6